MIYSANSVYSTDIEPHRRPRSVMKSGNFCYQIILKRGTKIKSLFLGNLSLYLRVPLESHVCDFVFIADATVTVPTHGLFVGLDVIQTESPHDCLYCNELKRPLI